MSLFLAEALDFDLEFLEHIKGDWIGFKSIGIEGRDFWNVVISPFTFFLLEFDGDSTDWSFLDTFHKLRTIL